MAIQFGGFAGQPLYSIQVIPCERCRLGKYLPGNPQPLGFGDAGNEVKFETCPDCKGTCVLVRGSLEKIDTVIETKGNVFKLSSAKFEVEVQGMEIPLLTLHYAKEIEKNINAMY